MTKKSLIFGLLGILAVSFIGCGQKETAKKVDLARREKGSVKKEENVITYAYLPQYAHEESYKRHHRIVEYLRQVTGLNIKQVFPGDFDEHMDMVSSGEIDISYSNPFIYVKIAHCHNAAAFARVVETYGKENFRGQIIVTSDNHSIKSIKDCAGKKWIAVDPASAGGYLYQLGLFYDSGIKKGDFAGIAFTPGPGGKQEKVVLAVYEGKYDIGSIREGTLEVAKDRYNLDISRIRVLAFTQWYPGWVYAARSGLNHLIVNKIKQALLKLDYNNPEDKVILQAADLIGVTDAGDTDFDPIRELTQKLNINLD